MLIMLYPHIDTFVQAARAFLQHDEALYNRLVGIALSMRDTPEPRYWCATVDQSGEVVAAALHRQQASVTLVFAPLPLAGHFASQLDAVTGIASTPDIRRRAWALWGVTYRRAQVDGAMPPRV